MAIKAFETFTQGQRDRDGFLVLHESILCVRCGHLANIRFIKDVDKRRRCQILGYCERCHSGVMGW